MKKTAQSLIEFAIILLVVTVVAIISLQIIGHKINTNTEKYDYEKEYQQDTKSTQEGINCTKMGLTWDEKNKVCGIK